MGAFLKGEERGGGCLFNLFNCSKRTKIQSGKAQVQELGVMQPRIKNKSELPIGE